MTDISDIQTEFNQTLFDLASQLKTLCPYSFVAKNLSVLEILLKTEPSKVIDLFTLRALKYKTQFDSGNDSFFLNGNFSADVDGDSAVVGKIFELKESWKSLSNDNRSIVRQYLKYLFDLSDEYCVKISSQ
jgi:hypothetical protein